MRMLTLQSRCIFSPPTPGTDTAYRLRGHQVGRRPPRGQHDRLELDEVRPGKPRIRCVAESACASLYEVPRV